MVSVLVWEDTVRLTKGKDQCNSWNYAKNFRGFVNIRRSRLESTDGLLDMSNYWVLQFGRVYLVA